MPISFPSSPSVGQTYTVGTRTWTWDGTIWSLQSAVLGVASISTAEIIDGAVTSPKIASSITLNTVAISGNLTVSGTTTTINSETLTIDDNIIVLNNNVTGSPTENSGVEIERGTSTNVLLRWNETEDFWEFTNDGSTYQRFISDTVTNSQSASYTLVASDRSKMVEMSVASANTLTIPTNATVAFPIGTTITVLQAGSGQTTIAGAVGVTVNATPGAKLRAQWSSGMLIKRATDTWVLMGDLSA